MRRTAALIVGGGPAGSAAAIALAKGGARPLLIERSAEAHDVVCGGFLGWDALAALERLGIDVAALGAQPIDRLRLFAGKRRMEARLPHAAAGLSRRTLDEELLAGADAAGAAIERGVAARRAAEEVRHAELVSASTEQQAASAQMAEWTPKQVQGDGFAVQLADAGTLATDALFLATGKHDLRGVARPREAAGEDPAVGLRIRLAPSAALERTLDGVIELHLFERGYAGLLLQEDGSANLCLSVAASRLAQAGGKAEGLIAALEAEAPALAERFGGAASTGTWIAVSGVPYGWRAAATVPGLFRLGDQAAVIASLAGDGVAIALTSGRMAAEHYLAGGAAGAIDYQRGFARRSSRSLRIAGALRTLGEDRRMAPPLVRLFGRAPGMAALLARLTRIDWH